MDSSKRALTRNKKGLSAEGVVPIPGSRCSTPSPSSSNLPLSKLKEKAGLRIKTQYALVRCICKEKVIAKKGQQTRLCPFCNRRIWLSDRRVLFQSNNRKLLQKLVRFRPDDGQCMGYYHPSFTLLSKLRNSSSISAGANRKTAYRCANPRRRMLEEREKYVW